jgi:ABC-type cobalamin/Fe3+-siderophores transport system ATPase subunit
MKKGVSGGECERLCVEMRLLSRLQLIFLHESTSGLDSSASIENLQLVRLVDFTQRGQQAMVRTNLLAAHRAFSLLQETFAAPGFPHPIIFCMSLPRRSTISRQKIERHWSLSI